MGRYRDLKGGMDICPYCRSEVKWYGYDYDFEHPLPYGSDQGEFQCTNCHIVWHENGRAYKVNE